MRVLKGWLILWVLALAGCTSVPEGIQPVRGFDLMRYLGTWHEIARQAGFDTRALIYPQAAAGPSSGSEDALPDGKPVPVLSTLGADHHDQRHP